MKHSIMNIKLSHRFFTHQDQNKVQNHGSVAKHGIKRFPRVKFLNLISEPINGKNYVQELHLQQRNGELWHVVQLGFPQGLLIGIHILH